MLITFRSSELGVKLDERKVSRRFFNLAEILWIGPEKKLNNEDKALIGLL